MQLELFECGQIEVGELWRIAQEFRAEYWQLRKYEGRPVDTGQAAADLQASSAAETAPDAGRSGETGDSGFPILLSFENNLRMENLSAPKALSESDARRFHHALDNFLDMSQHLLDDMNFMISHRSDETSFAWRRNFVRVFCSAFEGYGHCFRDMCSTIVYQFKLLEDRLTTNERKVLANERFMSASDRLKFSMSAVFKTFDIEPPPNFNSKEWQQATRFMACRDSLMHPRTPVDRELNDDQWRDFYQGGRLAFWRMP